LRMDERGQLIEARGAAVSCTFSYAATGQPLSDQRDELGVLHTQAIAGSYTTSVLGRFVTQYTRTAEGELLITDPTGRSHRVTELAPGVLQRQFSSGTREIAQYDLEGRCLLKTLDRRKNDGHSWIRSFHYSGEGDLLEKRDNERGVTRYTYDTSHRLQHVAHPDACVDAYEYDAADNLLRLPGDGPEGSTQLELRSGNRLRHANAQAFHYDDRDHVVRRDRPYGTVHYKHDALDQLTEIRAPDYLFSAKYDPLGRRTEKTVNGLTTRYYWDSDRLIAEVYPSGAVRVYVYEDALAMMPIMFVQYASCDAAPESGRRFYVVADHIGAVELVLNDQGEPAWQAQLDPYGLARIVVGKDFPQSLRFPGHFYDAETELHYNRFRYYDPSIGRYLESDPLGIEGGANLYAYTTNPLKEVDLRGEASKCPNGLVCKTKKLVRQLGRALSEGAARLPSLLKKKTPPKPDHSAALRKHVRDATAKRQREASSNNERKERKMVGGVINKKTGRLYDADNKEAAQARNAGKLHPLMKKRLAAQDKIVDTNRRLLDDGKTSRDVRNMSDEQLRGELAKDGIPPKVEGMDTTAQLRRTNDRVKLREDQFAKKGDSFHEAPADDPDKNWNSMKEENGSHGEVLATSKALDDIGPDATSDDLADLQLHNQKIPPKADQPVSDDAFDRCTFCRGATEGADTTPELSAAESNVDQRIEAGWTE
jgi:RHS repeat-associated protein